MTLLYLVRHGETDWNRAHRIQGTTDIPLNDVGRQQAGRAGRLLARRSWDGIFASPLSRAMETATIIAAELHLDPPGSMPALVERNYGMAEGLTGIEIMRKFPGDSVIEGRESRADVASRVMTALLDLAALHHGKHLIVVAHGAVIRTVLQSTGAPIQRGVPITNGSIHSFQFSDSGLKLVAFDDPIDEASGLLGDEDIDQQNLVEGREGQAL